LNPKFCFFLFLNHYFSLILQNHNLFYLFCFSSLFLRKSRINFFC
jgi:hypothetical protein